MRNLETLLQAIGWTCISRIYFPALVYSDDEFASITRFGVVLP